MLVNRRCTAGNINLLRFMFPNYDLINETNIPEKPIRPAIYSGDVSMIDTFVNRYKENNLDYIVVMFSSNIDLRDRRVLANIVFEKWRNGTLPKYLNEFIDIIPQDQFMEAIKIKWVSGKWTILKIDDENTFLNLIEALNKSKVEFIRAYFNCLENNKPYVLESSVLTFLTRAKNKSYRGNSFQYRKKLDMYKGTKLDNTLSAINEALDYNIDNPELRLLNLLMNIQDNTKNG